MSMPRSSSTAIAQEKMPRSSSTAIAQEKMARSSSAAIAQKKMARSAGLEPAASGVEFRCPIQLGHERNAGQAISHISVNMRGLVCAPSRWPTCNDFGLGQAEAERGQCKLHGLEGSAVNWCWAKPRQGLFVFRRAVALMTLKAIAGKASRILSHDAITGDFGDDRSGGNR